MDQRYSEAGRPPLAAAPSRGQSEVIMSVCVQPGVLAATQCPVTGPIDRSQPQPAARLPCSPPPAASRQARALPQCVVDNAEKHDRVVVAAASGAPPGSAELSTAGEARSLRGVIGEPCNYSSRPASVLTSPLHHQTHSQTDRRTTTLRSNRTCNKR